MLIKEPSKDPVLRLTMPKIVPVVKLSNTINKRKFLYRIIILLQTKVPLRINKERRLKLLQYLKLLRQKA